MDTSEIRKNVVYSESRLRSKGGAVVESRAVRPTLGRWKSHRGAQGCTEETAWDNHQASLLNGPRTFLNVMIQPTC